MKVNLIYLLLLFVCCNMSGQIKTNNCKLTNEEFDVNMGNTILSDGKYIVLNIVEDTPNPSFTINKPSIKHKGKSIRFEFEIYSTQKEGQSVIQMCGLAGGKYKYGPLPEGKYKVVAEIKYIDCAWEPVTIGPEEIEISD